MDAAAQRQFRLALMQLTVAVAPMHEWLAGELHYFRGQGYNDREAHAMATVTYAAVFGSRVYAVDDPDTSSG